MYVRLFFTDGDVIRMYGRLTGQYDGEILVSEREPIPLGTQPLPRLLYSLERDGYYLECKSAIHDVPPLFERMDIKPYEVQIIASNIPSRDRCSIMPGCFDIATDRHVTIEVSSLHDGHETYHFDVCAPTLSQAYALLSGARNGEIYSNPTHTW